MSLASPVMAWALIPIVIIFSYLAHAEMKAGASKAFLVETEGDKSFKDTVGEDYSIFVQCKLDCMGTCTRSCTTNTGEDPPTRKKACHFFCKATPTATPTLATTAPPDESCLRTPRSNVDIKRTERSKKRTKERALRKMKKEPLEWGYFLKTGARGRKFCCTRGRMKGATVRTPKSCKARTPK